MISPKFRYHYTFGLQVVSPSQIVAIATQLSYFLKDNYLFTVCAINSAHLAVLTYVFLFPSGSVQSAIPIMSPSILILFNE